MGTRGALLIGALGLAAVAPAPTPAQQSASYRVKEHVFNAGGHPTDGGVLSSGSYRIRLDAVGEAALGPGMSSALYRSDAGFGSAYPPPGEVADLRAPSKQTWSWRAVTAAGRYNLYRGLLSSLSGLSYGTCLQQDIVGTTATDAAVPSPSSGWFYLVTVKNRLEEEGTKGHGALGERGGSACP